MARSQPLPDCDLNSDNLHRSNAGLQRFTTVFTAAVSWLRSPASPSCGQLIDTDISRVPVISFRFAISSLAVSVVR